MINVGSLTGTEGTSKVISWSFRHVIRSSLAECVNFLGLEKTLAIFFNFWGKKGRGERFEPSVDRPGNSISVSRRPTYFIKSSQFQRSWFSHCHFSLLWPKKCVFLEERLFRRQNNQPMAFYSNLFTALKSNKTDCFSWYLEPSSLSCLLRHATISISLVT